MDRAYRRAGWFSGVVFSPFVKLCTVQGTISPGTSWQIHRPKYSWCISKPFSERGRALWQVLSADSRGPAEWAGAGQPWLTMLTQPREATLEQTGVMSALATDGKAPSPALPFLLFSAGFSSARCWWIKNNESSTGLTATFISGFVLA